MIPETPRATYRIQLNPDFGFDATAAVVAYLADLGISHVYLSPYLRARAGSSHGYDIIDHATINPELGGEDGLRTLCRTLAAHDLGQIMDFVPNHMGVMGSDNLWWLDVLEHGPASAFADHFDIDWYPIKQELRGKVLLPVLGDHYGRALEKGDLRLRFNAHEASLSVWYFEHRFPIDPRQYPAVLNPSLGRLKSIHAEALAGVLAAFAELAPQSAPGSLPGERAAQAEPLKSELARLCAEQPEITQALDAEVERFNSEAMTFGAERSLHRLIEAQAWRPAYWRVAGDEINYRRFFDINDLASLRMERQAVFDACHTLVLDMLRSGSLAGLRIDHVDGLYDPKDYLQRLRAAPAPKRGFYLVVEKILAEHEHLPSDWPVDGTTGYEFARTATGLQIDGQGLSLLTRSYRRFTGQQATFEETQYRSKQLVLRSLLSSELTVLATQLDRLSELDPMTRDFTYNSLRNALAEIIACFPVYRTYVDDEGPATDDLQYLRWAISQAKRRAWREETSVFDFIGDALALTWPESPGGIAREALVDLVKRFQQLTAPVTAKGVEDTALYRHYPLASINEVGASPERPVVTPAAFHHANHERSRFWSRNMLSTSTHDTKRSEDVRARLNVLSELPAQWAERIRRWRALNGRHRGRLDNGDLAPSRSHEHLLYQTLTGTWPLVDVDRNEWATYVERINAYMLKAAREAKEDSDWLNPNQGYERTLSDFIRRVLERERRNRFVADVENFQSQIAPFGLVNSLAQTAWKLTAPGLPDFYQGTELWDFSLVDPDNRRPVDYEARRQALARLRLAHRHDPQELCRRLLDELKNGEAKLFMIWRLLTLRRSLSPLFVEGGYQPLQATGPGAEHVVAYARMAQGRRMVVVTPRLPYRLTGGESLPLGPAWSQTRIDLSPLGRLGAGVEWLSNLELNLSRQRDVAVGKLLARFPVAVWVEGSLDPMTTKHGPAAAG